ncbi:MAG: class I mannose-6-phosphate isomerase [Burkholderiales bacterium]
MPRPSNYDKFPVVAVGEEQDCLVGWQAIAASLRTLLATSPKIICVECYPGVFTERVADELALQLQPAAIFRMETLLKNPEQIEAMLTGPLGNDPVFGRMNGIRLEDYFDAGRMKRMREQIDVDAGKPILLVGTGAALLTPYNAVLVYADMARWEIQQRWRRMELGNLGRRNPTASIAEKYKCGYFVEWRAADRLKKEILRRVDFLLDTNDPEFPKMISGDDFRNGLQRTTQRPFRVVPYFDPGPWGGHWMEEVCDLPRNAPNHAWCFDCVPEENSLLLGFDNTRVEVPSIDLIFSHPQELLGDAVHARFGTEFPIRFDFLDTMGGGNLSLQVHPLTEYIQDQFGMHYTQDESYYLLDAEPDAVVFLGLKDDVSPRELVEDLHTAQAGGPPFPAEKYINSWPAKKHDHFLIPAGTIHCSGRNSMVLEISASPYIFTFKLWDWNRMGLDGKLRPIHLEHGAANIQWDRNTLWVRENLVNRTQELDRGEGWHEEATGLHECEFIETRRHWFRNAVPHNTHGGVNILNLVEGNEAVVESPCGKFAPFVVHYAETFIIPAAVGAYTIRPHGESDGKECATIKAWVRTHA